MHNRVIQSTPSLDTIQKNINHAFVASTNPFLPNHYRKNIILMIQYTLFDTAGHQLSPEQTRLPITLFRWGWGTLILVRRTLIPSGIIGFASDIGQNIYPIAGVSLYGFATYDSGDFGWLHGTRKAQLYKLSSWKNNEISENISDIFRENPYTWPEEAEFRLIPDLIKLSDDDCLFYENGENEYSCEITKIYGESAELLLRYTVDGNNSGDGVEYIKNFKQLQQ